MFKWGLKALSPFLDPILGQNMELGLCGERMLRKMLLLGPSSFFAHTLLSSLHICEGALYCDLKHGQKLKL